MNAGKVCDQLVRWLEANLQRSGAEGLAVGLSGGIDSAVAAALAQRAAPGRTLGVLMPCHSNLEDQADAERVARHVGIPHVVVDLSPVYDILARALQPTLPAEADPGRLQLARANVKPRLRMLTLYHAANVRGYLVVGTGNRSELYTGYYTKYGDGGVDLLPLGDLVKGEVRELARYLELPEAIIQRTPSAGLWEGQSDEGEMGITYAELDRYLLEGAAAPELLARIEALHRVSRHKRELPPIPRVAR
ncbi:NAD(+) synthase [Limnochorda pilosa]|uniref:NH(3)-dependent NAD(+) synthetase n=1 Tax=Limnochorda pilosa TaxID=1555112 RepID=A0A0K2SQE4_LIMPI|nr:NAD(+) synthase [Limnochorda pilosa]BAS29348.1 NAD synthetase [Limnochorda pilosa]